MQTIPQIEPTKFASGLTVSFQKTFPNYLYSDGFTKAIYTISGSAGNASISGACAAELWTFTLTATLNTLPAGAYTLSGYVEKGSGESLERYEVYRGMLEVTASLVTAVSTDYRSFYKKILDQIETAITEYTVKPVDAITISTVNGGSRTFQRPSLLTLQNLHSKYVTLVNKEVELANRANGKAPRRIIGRFGCGV